MNTSLYRMLQKTYGLVLHCTESCFGIDFAKKFDVKLRFGRDLDLRDPKNLADKVSYLSLHALPEEAARCTDKWEVRDYVARKGLGHILIPVHGLPVSRAEELDFSQFPDRFVLKATHGCRMNYICTDKSRLDPEACRKEVRHWLRTTYGTYSVEPHYRNIPHRVYCESFLGDTESPIDYKIFCLNGEPSYIQVCQGRQADSGAGSNVEMYLYDTQWQFIDGLRPYRGHVPGTGSVPRPERLAQMLDIARKLSADFDFVRVDLYECGGQIWFGELTFTPANGAFPSYTRQILEREGRKLTITTQTSGRYQ